MAKKFDVEIVTAQGHFWRGEADMVIMHTVEGEMAVMAGHIPVVAALKPSPLRIRDENGTMQIVSVGGGFMEMEGKKATFLLRSAEWPKHIDVARAAEAKRRAEERLLKADDTTDQERAEAALQRAVSRLKIAQSNRE